MASPVDRAREAVVALLKAQHKTRGNDLEKPPPLYYGTPECQDLPRNAKVFAERIAPYSPSTNLIFSRLDSI